MRKKKKDKPIPETPTLQLVSKFIQKFTANKRYADGDTAIANLIKLFPLNQHLHEVLAKVCVINNLYGTGINATYDMAEHIIEQKIDNDLKNGSHDVVDRIAQLTVSGKTRHNFSFATKYCAWHAPMHYPIYDAFVQQMLLAYRDKDHFTDFDEAALRKYSSFKAVMCEFIKYYKLSQFLFKEIDYFLWGYGKELFPKQYKKTEPIAALDAE